MAQQTSQLVEMESRLAADTAGTYRDEVINRLYDQTAELKRQADGGLAPAEFDAATKLIDSMQTAAIVVRKVWQSQHGA